MGNPPRNAASPAIAFRRASYAFGGRPVCLELEFEVAAGETLVLLGRSGSGKTTALRMVNAMLYPTSGEVLIEGVGTRRRDPIELRRSTGYVIQETGLFPHYTVRENVALVPRLLDWPAERIKARVEELLERVGLPPGRFGERLPRELSGGERQRVGVARALAARPRLLLLDEPFGALDPVTRLEVQRLFLELRRESEAASVFVTHDVREALLVATRIGLLVEGALEVLATPEAFLESAHPEAVRFRACLDGAHLDSSGGAG